MTTRRNISTLVLLWAGLFAAGSCGPPAQCDFTARCEGNTLVTCSVPETIGPATEVRLDRQACEGANPVCIADDTWNSGCFKSAQPSTCNAASCMGSAYVLCTPLKVGPGGAVQTFETHYDCSERKTSQGETYVCHLGVGDICRPPGQGNSTAQGQ